MAEGCELDFLKGRTLLVVDDDPKGREWLRVLLKGNGFQVEVAENGREAREFLEFNPVDLVITDLLMPEMDGFMLLRHIRDDDKRRNTPVLVYTATFTDESDRNLAINLGANAFLLKPDEADQILPTVVTLLKEKNAVEYTPPAWPDPEDKRFIEYTQAIFRKLTQRTRELEATAAQLAEHEAQILEQNEAIQENASFLRMAAKMAKVGAWSLELPGGRYRWSEETRHIHGLASLKPISNLELLEFYVGKDREKIREAFAICAREGTPFDLELRFQNAQGQRLWVRVSGEAVRGDDGQVTRIQGAIQDLTPRVEAEKRLRESETRYRSIFENQHLVMLLIDPLEEKIIEANPAAVSFYGWSAQCLRSMSIQDLFHDPDSEVSIHLQRARAGFEKGFGFRQNLADGSLREVEVYSGPLEIEGKTLVYSLVNDVTQRVQAERSLASVVESSPIPVALLDSENRVITWNSAAEAVFGWSGKEILGQRLPMILDELDPEYLEFFKRVREGKNITGAEFAATRKDGEYRTIRVSSALLQTGEDSPSAILIFLEDVTAAKAAEAQLKLQSGALDAADNHILITDRGGRVEWVNRSFELQTGYSLEEAKGENPGKLLGSGQQSAAFYSKLWETILSGKVWRGELINQRKDGSEYEEDMTITPMFNTAGDITHFVAVKQDVTEKKAMQRQLLRAQRMESIGALAGGIAHDLNNILAPIMMGAEMLETRTTSKRDRETLEVIRTAASRGADMVRQLLTFSRGSEDSRLQVEPGKLLRDLKKFLNETFPKQIRLVVDKESSSGLLEGNPTEIYQILLNLCVNARDAMPRGGTLRLGLEDRLITSPSFQNSQEVKPGRYVVFHVEDSGEGIPPEARERIFEPFFTTKPQGQGTGLGLSTSVGIARSHGGYLTFESQPGKTSFELLLPLSEADASSAAPAPERSVIPPKKEGHILIAEDEAAVRELARTVLSGWGYRVSAAVNGAEALAIFDSDPGDFNLGLIDLRMPILGGAETIRAIRRKRPELPIIAMTGFAPQEDLQALENLGNLKLVQKPFSMKSLADAVDGLLK